MRGRGQFGKTWPFVDIIDSWKLVGWGKMGFKAQTCWTDLLAFWGVWNRSRILNFGPDRLFFRFSPSPAPRYLHTKYEKFLISGCRDICNKKNFGYSRLERTESQTDWKDRWKDWQMNGQMDKKYIPVVYFICRGIKNHSKIPKSSSAFLVTMDWYTV